MIDVGHVGEVNDPIVIAAFEGWNDAGESATRAVEHLVQAWDAELMAVMDPEDYYDFQVNRPRVALVNGQRQLTWPTTRVLLARDTPLGRDVILVLGIEPSIRWRTYVNELLTLAMDHGSTLWVSMGALLADVPHSRPIPVSVTSEDAELREVHDVERSTYEGPSGIVGVLMDQAHQRDLPGLSVWAAVPHYAGGPPSPKATLALVSRLEELLGCVIDDGDLTEQARAWERGVDELAASDDEVAEYVEALEDAQDTADLPEASGDAIAREFEKYLRRRGGHEAG
ncbi:PAC2 family protein [Ornithinimicrobium sp. F0845]|uniref:PAC2 family protein n=1 Tax=Ornithinimicrobium sp. F0845 TaxID=2926412 RepID=UPI001FF22AD1|nr:PAC2 family protein [Ornithinimicrobium sp. F0845]MCK0113261.1 PAC2 family protein [Ornithinimicrobium sp. F0845]